MESWIVDSYESGAIKLYSLGKPSSLVPNMCLLIFISHGYTSIPSALCKKHAARLFEFFRQSVCAGTNGNSENTFDLITLNSYQHRRLEKRELFSQLRILIYVVFISA
jgi:hypothetical protein